MAIRPRTRTHGEAARTSSVRPMPPAREVLAVLAGEVDLDEDLDGAAELSTDPRDGLSEPGAVHGVDHVGALEDPARLVPLEMPDEVPARPLALRTVERAAQRVGLLGEGRGPVLSEVQDAFLEQRPGSDGVHGLGDRDQRGAGLPAAAAADSIRSRTLARLRRSSSRSFMETLPPASLARCIPRLAGISMGERRRSEVLGSLDTGRRE